MVLNLVCGESSCEQSKISKKDAFFFDPSTGQIKSRFRRLGFSDNFLKRMVFFIFFQIKNKAVALRAGGTRMEVRTSPSNIFPCV